MKMKALLEVTRAVVCSMSPYGLATEEAHQRRIELAHEAEKETGLSWDVLSDLCWGAVRVNRDVKLEQVLMAMKIMGWKAEVSYEVK